VSEHFPRSAFQWEKISSSELNSITLSYTGYWWRYHLFNLETLPFWERWAEDLNPWSICHDPQCPGPSSTMSFHRETSSRMISFEPSIDKPRFQVPILHSGRWN
jgi:hypothetical protein